MFDSTCRYESPSTEGLSVIRIISFVILFALSSYIVAASNIDILPWFDRYNEKRILQILLLLTISIPTLGSTSYRRATCSLLLNFSWFTLVSISLFFILGSISSLTHTHTIESLFEVSLFYLLLFVALTVAVARITLGPLFDRIVAIAISALALIYITVFISSYFAAITQSVPLLPHELFGNFSVVRFFNQVQSWLLPLLPLLIFLSQKEEMLFHNFILTLTAGWWMMLFASGGRGTLLGIFIGLITMHILWPNTSKPALNAHVKAACFGILLYLLLFFILSNLLDPASSVYETQAGANIIRDSGTSGRLYLWEHAFAKFLQSPLLGEGPLSLACSPGDQLIAAHPHSSFFQLLAEWGLPATLIVLFLFIIGLRGWKNSSKEHIVNQDSISILYPFLFLSLITATVHSLLSGVIVMPMSQTVMSLVLGWMIGIRYSTTLQKNTTYKYKRSYEVTLCIVTLCALYIVMTGISRDVFSIEEEQRTYTKSKLLPRVWQQGRICLK